ncbi:MULTISPECIES: hypothetical protein [Rhodococcus]|uniref:Uncharacterized protein n=1 Tax=Rhodococcus oxybenzonivorans TaxID=1990687 RepID=A0AAE5A582_9NOCA|nr:MULTISPECIES: hypothetical protein [Rhodococcus]MDV7243615.1 hypothetical protein [Rhodococcus oxybenzonivorans]MDV7264322.1 hypothetical protein [Rhodococcus oxybenzonivorans]MDV7275143.1 hypothetical protein [Rhodococcus oxybenzonivorans]MDV7335381.1 hypothetical protein [Rhodococcus oxybenzonivorans]MDV7346092.1 hypothetical protein [Rhodococcus oxybenzonivorans]
MSSNPAADQITRLSVERDQLLLDVRELEGRLEKEKRRLDDVTAKITSLRRVEHELLRRHPELE